MRDRLPDFALVVVASFIPATSDAFAAGARPQGSQTPVHQVLPPLSFDEARGLFLEGEYEIALAAFDVLAAEDPEDREAPPWVVRSLIALGRYPAAAAVLRDLMEAWPEWRPSPLEFSPHEDSGRYLRRVRRLEAYAASRRDEPDPQLLLAYVSALQGATAAAREMAWRALAQHPKDSGLRSFLDRLTARPEPRPAVSRGSGRALPLLPGRKPYVAGRGDSSP